MHDGMLDKVALWDLASRQHGALHIGQVLDLGVSHAHVGTLVARGDLVRAAPRVLVVAGSADTAERRASTAVLNAGADACLSHQSGAAWWDLPGFLLEPWQVTRGRRIKDGRPYGATVHEPRRFRTSHVILLRGIPVTSPARTIFDLASLPGMSPGRVARALDTAWAARLVGHGSLHAMLDDLSGRGRRGITVMRQLLEERGPGFVPVESSLERRFLWICEKFGIGGFERQVVLGDHEVIGRVDFHHQWQPVIVEIDSDRYHTSLLDRAADTRRDERLTAMGYTIRRFSEKEVWYRPESVAHELLAVLRAAA
ncbi:MAG: endonuclease domain-containing protein [Acidimicrobiales bacterium]|jgi:very-short-patch-repair endonuclease|nr:endonuclease domain-containing protein [Acidimicrobiales bacterium]